MWEPGETLRTLEGFTPVPAPRDGDDRASAVRLHDYLSQLTGRLQPLPGGGHPLFLHLHVHLPRQANLLHGYDLERYLTPLFGVRWLTASRFGLVIGTKGMEGPSRLALGLASAIPAPRSPPPGCRAAPGEAPASPEWIEALRRALARAGSVPLPEGPVQLQVELGCLPDSNWVTLWLAAEEAMGPILGYDRSLDPHHPRSDRLTRLEFHRRPDVRPGDPVEVLFRWSAVPLEVA